MICLIHFWIQLTVNLTCYLLNGGSLITSQGPLVQIFWPNTSRPFRQNEKKTVSFTILNQSLCRLVSCRFLHFLLKPNKCFQNIEYYLEIFTYHYLCYFIYLKIQNGKLTLNVDQNIIFFLNAFFLKLTFFALTWK